MSVKGSLVQFVKNALAKKKKKKGKCSFASAINLSNFEDAASGDTDVGQLPPLIINGPCDNEMLFIFQFRVSVQRSGEASKSSARKTL